MYTQIHRYTDTQMQRYRNIRINVHGCTQLTIGRSTSSSWKIQIFRYTDIHIYVCIHRYTDIYICKGIEIYRSTDTCSWMHTADQRQEYVFFLKNTDTQIYRYTDTQIYICIHRCTDTWMHRYMDAKVYKYTDVQIHAHGCTQLTSGRSTSSSWRK